MSNHLQSKLLTYFISLVWIINGLLCKVLNLVPRHAEIVARILGNDYAHLFTISIGLSEIGMAVWILTGILPKLNAIAQLAIVLTMNVIEFTLAPDLLLWGRANLIFAVLFCILVYYNQFILAKTVSKQS